MEKMTDRELIANANARLAEDQPRGSINEDRLEDDIRSAREYGDDRVTVKIPSGWEFTLSFEEAAAFVRANRSRRW